MLYEIFFTSLIGLTWGAFFVKNSLTRHGRNSELFRKVDGQIDKDLFILFYLNGTVVFCAILLCNKAVSVSTCLLGMHIIRRLVESSFYTYTWNSTMHIVHFITGIIYYPLLLIRSLDSKHALVYPFTAGTIAQTLLHYYLFQKRRTVKSLHYFTELIIHSSIQIDYLNICWICTLILVNILNRRK